LRTLIQQYSQDKKKAPQSLDDLVQTGYLKRIPSDPTTGKADWVSDELETLDSVDQQETGIGDVHSASSERACDGTAYNTW
jgi:general secretion pathway protein G